MEDILSPMNHREIEYNAQFLPDIKDISIMQSCKEELLSWLDETGKRVFDPDLIMDYGTDCLRLYLLFEKTPKEHDAPYYDSWQEGALEGLYKFLGRYRRLVLVANMLNQRGNYDKNVLTDIELKKMQNAVKETDERIKYCIENGNTMRNRHNIAVVLMELLNVLYKGLRIGEAISALRTHAVEIAVPHSNNILEMAGTNSQKSDICNPFLNNEINSIKNEQDNCCINLQVTSLLTNFIILIAPYAPCLSKVLWNSIANCH